jgi:hypothetical protein
VALVLLRQESSRNLSHLSGFVAPNPRGSVSKTQSLSLVHRVSRGLTIGPMLAAAMFSPSSASTVYFRLAVYFHLTYPMILADFSLAGYPTSALLVPDPWPNSRIYQTRPSRNCLTWKFHGTFSAAGPRLTGRPSFRQLLGTPREGSPLSLALPFPLARGPSLARGLLFLLFLRLNPSF